MIKQFIIALVAILALDAVWLGVVAKNFYKNNIGQLLAEKPNLVAAAIFYLIFAAAVVFFVVNPALIGGYSVSKVIAVGAFLGLALYATYDLTSQALIKDWPVLVTVVDLAWGMFITAAVSVITFLILK